MSADDAVTPGTSRIPVPLRIPLGPTLVVGGYGYRNAGDEAILSGLLHLLGRDRVTVVSRAPAETAAIHDVETVAIAGAARALRAHRGLVIGGGGLFGRDMGGLGRLLPLAGLVAAAGGREVSLLGIGIDREMPAVSSRLVRMLAARAVSVTVRDQGSRDIFASFGIDARQGPDLSTFVTSAGRMAGLRHLRAAGCDPERRRVIGLCLTGVEDVLAVRAERAVVAAIDARPDLDFCMLPMSRHPFVRAHNDDLLARRLVARRDRVRIVRPPDDPSELLGVFDAFDAIIGMRYHSLLFAERAGIPIIAVPYAEKCRQWLADRGRDPVEPTPGGLIGALESAVSEAAA